MEFMDFAEREDEHPIQAGEHGHEETGTRGENANAVKPSGKRKREKRTKAADTPTAQQPKSRHLAKLKLLESNKHLLLHNLLGNQIRKKKTAPTAVERYAELLKLSEPPNIVVVQDKNGRYIIADGHNRAAAAALAGRKDIVADVHAGTRKDARIVGLEMNQGSLAMSPAERKAMLDELLEDTGLGYSVQELAAMTGLCNATVNTRKKELETGDFLSSASAMKRSKSPEEKFNDAVKTIIRLIENNGPEAVVKALNSLPAHIREDVVSRLNP